MCLSRGRFCVSFPLGMNKRTLLLGWGACMALAATSCQQNRTDVEDNDTEIATAVADGAIPPWLQVDDSGDPQVPAGKTTAYVDRNSVNIPEPDGDPLAGLDEPAAPPDSRVADSGARKASSASSSARPKKKSQSSVAKKGKKPAVYFYTVRKGDSLDKIARKNGTTVSAIKRCSGLKSDLIRPGQKLKVPYNLKERSAAGSRGASHGSAPAVRYAKTRSYTVKKGDTLKSIAQKFGSTEKAIRNASGLKSSSVKAGQTVKIPM